MDSTRNLTLKENKKQSKYSKIFYLAELTSFTSFVKSSLIVNGHWRQMYLGIMEQQFFPSSGNKNFNYFS